MIEQIYSNGIEIAVLESVNGALGKSKVENPSELIAVAASKTLPASQQSLVEQLLRRENPPFYVNTFLS